MLNWEKNQDKITEVEKLLKIILTYRQEDTRTISLNKPIYEITSSRMVTLGKPTNKGEFSWEKTDKMSLFKNV